MTTKARPKGLRCPSCNELIGRVYILHTVCERWTIYEREDGALPAYRRYDTVGDTEMLSLAVGVASLKSTLRKCARFWKHWKLLKSRRCWDAAVTAASQP